jgi:uncharacterized protein (DUF885 family)
MAGKVKKVFKWLGIGTGVLIVGAGSFGAHEWYADKPFFVNNFYNLAFLNVILESPESLTAMGMLEQIPLLDIDARMNLYPDADLTESELITKKIVMELLGDPVKSKKYRFYNYPVNQLFGLQNNVPRFLDTFHKVNDAEDAEHYIARLSKIDTKFEQNMEGLLVREEMGIIPPTFVIDKSLEIMQEFVDQAPEDNVLYVSFKTKMEESEEFSDEERSDFLAQAVAKINEDVYPAYQSYIDYFTGLRAKSNNDAGVWKFPDGEAYYNYELRNNTTTDMTADEIHAIGLSEVDRIQGEIMAIFESEGYDTTQDFTTLINGLAEEERFYYPDTDEGREQILEDYAKIIDEIEAGLDDAFNIRPKADVVVKRVPEFSEKTAPGAYYNSPSMDGSRPGTFYANLYDIKATPKYGMRTLAYHEGVPGHHFQLAIQNELEDVPMLRTQAGFTAFAEGWALYS